MKNRYYTRTTTIVERVAMVNVGEEWVGAMIVESGGGFALSSESCTVVSEPDDGTEVEQKKLRDHRDQQAEAAKGPFTR